MSTAQLAQALAAPATDRVSARRETRRPGASDTAFSTQIAAFYPYPRAGAESATRIPPAGESRVGRAASSAALTRRRHARDG